MNCVALCFSEHITRMGQSRRLALRLEEKRPEWQCKHTVGDLNQFMKLKDHYKADSNLMSNLLTPDTRSGHIKYAYERAVVSSINLIKSNRNYAMAGTEVLTCQPVLKEINGANLMEIELNKPVKWVQPERLPRNIILRRAKTPLCKSKISVTTGTQVDESSEEVAILDEDALRPSQTPSSDDLSVYRLPSPKEQTVALAEEFPSAYVPIDVTGITFHRLSSFRRSLIHGDVVLRRKACRNKENKIRRRNTYSESSSSCTEKDPRKRSRRKSESGSGYEKTDHAVQTESTEADIYASGRILDLNRETKVSHTIEFQAEVHQNENHQDDHQKTFTTINQDTSLKASGKATLASSHSAVESRQEADERNSLILRNGQVYVPLVKLRETTPHKVAGDDGRSSSGNWSGSSSTHASCDSENMVNANSNLCKIEHPLSRSNSSIGKDSVISDINHATSSNVAGPSSPNQDLNGYYSDISGMSTSFTTERTNTNSDVNDVAEKVVIRHHQKPSVQFANRDSESWLQYFDHDSSETVTPTEATQSDSGTITPNKQMSPTYEKKRLSINDFEVVDDVESIYSVDNDGYYTSMHSDSGLFRDRPGIKLMITPNSSFRCKGKRDSISSVSTIGDISVNSVLSRTETEGSLEASNITIANLRPCPPQRRSSLRKNSSSIGDDSSRSQSRSPVMIMSESENSDSVRRLKAKTCIDATRYPSLCATLTTSEGSDEEATNSSASSTGSDEKKFKSSLRSYKRFSIKDIFGSFSSLSRTVSRSKEILANKIRRNSGHKSGSKPESRTKAKTSLHDSPSLSSNSPDVPESSYPKSSSSTGSENNSISNVHHSQISSLSPSPTLDSEAKRSSGNSCTPSLRIPSLLRKGYLDANDQIIFSSNSLGRRRDGHPMNYLDRTSSVREKRSATIPNINEAPLSSPVNFPSKIAMGRLALLNGSIPSPTRYQPVKFPRSLNLPNPSEIKTSLSSLNTVFKSCPPDSKPTTPITGAELTPKRLFASPLNQTTPAVRNQAVESVKSESSASNGIDVFNKKKSNLSTEDLLVLIHNSKKRMNIREKSSSPESSSPSGVRANTAGSRQSWAGSPLTSSGLGTTRCRQSLAIDRLGTSKPTPIKEFKKLLSQTRTSNGTNHGKSASELLKATSPFSKRPQTPIISCSTSFIGTGAAPTNGSRTRIINGRFYRSPYRLEAMYPPIEEANSEENLLNESENKDSFHSNNNVHVNSVHNTFVGTTSTWV